MPSREKLLEVIAIQTEVAPLGLDLGGLMSLVVQRTLSLVGADGAAVELAEGDDMVIIMGKIIQAKRDLGSGELDLTM